MKEEEFWQAIYIAAIRAGTSADWALYGADVALETYQKKFKVAEIKPIKKDKWEGPTT